MPKEGIIIPGKKEGKEITLPPDKNLEAMVENFSPLMDIFLWDVEGEELKPMKGRPTVRDKDFRVYIPGGTCEDYRKLHAHLGARRSTITFPWMQMEYTSAIDGEKAKRLPRYTTLRQWTRSYHRNYYNAYRNLESMARSEIHGLGYLSYPLLITSGASAQGENALATMESEGARSVETAQELREVMLEEYIGEENWGNSFSIMEFPSLEMGQMRLWLSGSKVVGVELHPLDPYEGSTETLEEVKKAAENFLAPNRFRGRSIPHRAVDVARLITGAGNPWQSFNGWIFTGITSACVATSVEFRPEYLGISEKGRRRVDHG